jgi:hypothetical protein
MQGAADLRSAAYNGLIPPDVMNKLFDISRIPLPVTDLIGTDDSTADFKEWIVDDLGEPVDNAYSEKHTWTDEDDTTESTRVRNHVQLLMKRVKVTRRGIDTKEYATNDSLSKQITRNQQRLRREVEMTMLKTDQASQADAGTATPGLMGSLGTWIETAYVGDTGDATNAGGFDTATGLTAAPTPGTPRDLSETLVRNTATAVWKNGGNPTVAVSLPDVINAFSDYLFTSSARIATVQSEAGQSPGGVTAKGFIDVFESNNGVVLQLVGDRLMQVSDPGGTPHTAMYIVDPQYLSLAYVTGYMVEPLAKTGPQEDRQMMVDVTLCVGNEKAHGMIADLKPVPAVTP